MRILLMRLCHMEMERVMVRNKKAVWLDANSSGLLYNLYADRQLGLDLVPEWVYDMQSTFYPTAENKYGVPLDTRHTYTKG